MRKFVAAAMLAVTMCSGLIAQNPTPDPIQQNIDEVRSKLATARQKYNEMYMRRNDVVQLLNMLRSNHQSHVNMRPLYLGAFCYDFSEAAYQARILQLNQILLRVDQVSNLNPNCTQSTNGHEFNMAPDFHISLPLRSQASSAIGYAEAVLSLFNRYVTLMNRTPADIRNMAISSSTPMALLNPFITALNGCNTDLAALQAQASADIQSELQCWQTYLNQNPGTGSPGAPGTGPGLPPVGPPVTPPNWNPPTQPPVGPPALPPTFPR